MIFRNTIQRLVCILVLTYRLSYLISRCLSVLSYRRLFFNRRWPRNSFLKRFYFISRLLLRSFRSTSFFITRSALSAFQLTILFYLPSLSFLEPSVYRLYYISRSLVSTHLPMFSFYLSFASQLILPTCLFFSI